MKTNHTCRQRGLALWGYVLLIAFVAGAAFGVLLLYQNMVTRKAEATQHSVRITELDETTVDPSKWGLNFPRQYDSYKRTVDNYGTKYGGAGSEAAPVSKLKTDSHLPEIFAGYAFAIDYNQRRGHAHMLEDQRVTKRVTERPQTGACLHCHTSNTVLYRKEGLKLGSPGTLEESMDSENGRAQLMAGFEAVCKMPYKQAAELAQHPVACIDCHDPKTMDLRVTKPGFIRGIDVLAHSDEPVPHLPSIERWRTGDRKQPYDANRDASRQEMRSMVCGQCHVEYYCGPKMTLFFPWNKGLKVEQIEATYNETKFPDGHRFYDFAHAKTGAEVLKAQHPEFELWSQGIHARSGVSCADCHMPYVREGAIKVSSHHVRSPLLNIAQACQTCHRYPESEIKARVEAIQDRTAALMDRAETATVGLIRALEAAKKQGATAQQLAPAYELQRKAQWRVDFINAENSMGFHAPQEAARILAEAIDYARQGELLVLGIKLAATTAAVTPAP